jgi:CubicO group peptidase (beta-lactamase class C family)
MSLTFDGCQIDALKTVDMDRLHQVITDFDIRATNTHGLVIERHGKILIELYFTGVDRPPTAFSISPFGRRTKFTSSTRHDMRSISKSVVGLVFGIAKSNNYIGDLSTPILDYFPDYKDLSLTNRRQITLENVLTMTSGLAWEEAVPYSSLNIRNSETLMNWSLDRYRYILSRPIVAPAGKIFNYSGGATALVAEVIERSVDVSFQEYTRKVLFDPLQIVDFEWRKDIHGRVLSFSGLRLLPRDIVKIGRLVLNGGQWEQKQVVPAAWILQSTLPQVNTEFGMHYGFQWWSGSSVIAGKKILWNAALGNGGQRLFMVPSLDLNIVITAGRYGLNIDHYSNEFFEKILTAFV